MATPQQLLDAEAEADRLIAELNKPEGEATPPAAGEEGDASIPAKTDDIPPEPAKETAAGDEPPAPANATAALEAKLAEVQAELAKLQAAHDTLRGKTYAEVPRVLSENKSLRDRITELEGQLSQKVTAPAGQPVTGKAADILAKLKEKTDEDVAEDIQRLVNAIVEEQVSARVAPVEGRVEGLRKTAIEMAEERYLRELTEKVPDWRDIASSPAYSEFLGQRDDLSGATFYDLAKGALDRLDASHMSKFFNKFKAAQNPVTKTVTQDAPAAATERPSGKEALVAPKSAARAAGSEAAGEEKPDYITTKQMEQWSKKDYRDKLTREQEAALEARLDRAIQKGWIVPV